MLNVEEVIKLISNKRKYDKYSIACLITMIDTTNFWGVIYHKENKREDIVKEFTALIQKDKNRAKIVNYIKVLNS